MTTSSSPDLRIIRFFLPALTEADLRVEIDELCTAQERMLKAQLDELEKTRQADEAEIQRCCDIAIRRTKRFWFLHVLLIPLLGLGIIYLVRAAADRHRARVDAATARQKLASQVQTEADRLQQVAECETAGLEQQAAKLFDAYSASIASDEEVRVHVESVLRAAADNALPALGLAEDDVLESKDVETSIPTILLSDRLHPAVESDIERSASMLIELRDDIVRPMIMQLPVAASPGGFRRRILRVLGLDDRTEDIDNGRLTSATALRFAPDLGAFLAGHYFYQRIVCADDFVGVFHSFANVLRPGVPHTTATHLFYQEITAVRIETQEDEEQLVASQLELRRHTRSLELTMSDGRTYQLTADLGSSGMDLGSKHTNLLSSADDDDDRFEKQIESLRQIIRDTRRQLMRAAWSSDAESI